MSRLAVPGRFTDCPLPWLVILFIRSYDERITALGTFLNDRICATSVQAGPASLPARSALSGEKPEPQCPVPEIRGISGTGHQLTQSYEAGRLGVTAFRMDANCRPVPTFPQLLFLLAPVPSRQAPATDEFPLHR